LPLATILSESSGSGLWNASASPIGALIQRCNVGNFGAADRVDRTVSGAEANLAACLQSIASPGRIVMSDEIYRLVRNPVAAHPEQHAACAAAG
jgi:adenylate cyclase